MRNLFLIFIAFAGIGCSQNLIQIFSLSSTNTAIMNNRFVFENDTIKITYVFWAERGVMAFDIYNKMDKPIYVDWKSSSFIYNGNKLNYWKDELQTKTLTITNGNYQKNSTASGYYNGDYYNGSSVNSLFLDEDVSSNFSGVAFSTSNIVKPERITFIPPKSNYQFSSFYLVAQDPFEFGENKQTLNVPRNDDPNWNTTIYYNDYSFQNSPLKFRSYLSISFSENTQQYFFVDNEFYLSSVKEMDLRHFRGIRMGYDNNQIPVYEKSLKNKMSFYLWKNKF